MSNLIDKLGGIKEAIKVRNFMVDNGLLMYSYRDDRGLCSFYIDTLDEAILNVNKNIELKSRY